MTTVQGGGIFCHDATGADSVAGEEQHMVVILYEHPLLGEGIATYLRAKIGVEATLGSALDPDAVKSALVLGPRVVIFESSIPYHHRDLRKLAPGAVLIDLSTVITRGYTVTPCTARLEQILQAVRDCSSTEAMPSEVQQFGPSRSVAI